MVTAAVFKICCAWILRSTEIMLPTGCSWPVTKYQGDQGRPITAMHEAPLVADFGSRSLIALPSSP